MKKREISRLNHRIILKKNCTKIIDSYDLSDKESIMMAERIIFARRVYGYKTKRSLESYIREIIAHNRLYKWHLFRSHTKDTDLEENITRIKELIYLIVGWY